MSKTTVDANVDAVLPSSGWPGAPNNLTLQTALDDLKNFQGGNVVVIDDTDSPYVLGLTDNVVLCSSAGGVISVHLPLPASADGRSFVFKKVDGGINAVTIDADTVGATTIEGNTTDARMDAQYDVMTIYCDGAEYFIVSEKIA